jgi:hypothetical protein
MKEERIRGFVVDERIYVVGDETLVDGVVDEEKERNKMLTMITLNLGKTFIIDENQFIIRNRVFLLDDVEIIPVRNFPVKSLAIGEKIKIKLREKYIPVLSYFDAIYGSPAVSVPLWFVEPFISECSKNVWCKV